EDEREVDARAGAVRDELERRPGPDRAAAADDLEEPRRFVPRDVEARLALLARDLPHLHAALDVDANERRLPLRPAAEVGDERVDVLRRPRDLDPLLDLHASATVASTSTGIPAGSSATPIALRAQRPRSSP